MIYDKIFRPLLFQLDAEVAHDSGVKVLELASRSKLIRKAISAFCSSNTNQDRSTCLFGLKFPNKIGLAAGLDKDGRFPLISESIGFGHVEVGTVTPLPQPGNPKPRLFRIPESNALVNRMGFNNNGVDALVLRVKKLYPKSVRKIPLGINIGKGKDTPLENAANDYTLGFSKVCDVADYITINISSPNTPNLRKLHDVNYLLPLLKSVRDVRNQHASEVGGATPPCLIKISPDETFAQIEQLVGLACDYNFNGIIACNTSVRQPSAWFGKGYPGGGVSGTPLDSRANEVIKFISKLTHGRLPIIGAGGVSDIQNAQQKLDAGASLLQIYTSLIYKGPLWPSRLAKALPIAREW